MSREITVRTALRDHKAFLQVGFYDPSFITVRTHDHSYAEIHLVVDGCAAFEVEGTEYRLQEGDALIIPKHVYHACMWAAPTVRHAAFGVDFEPEAMQVRHFEPATLAALFREIEHAVQTDDHTGVAAYLSLICFSLEKGARVESRAISDYSFLIRDFFSNYYAEDVHLCDLARALHLSERQAERLVLEHTGHSFRSEMIATRMVTAERLLATESLTLQQIAEYVGYRSYAGFWKAWKAYHKESHGTDIPTLQSIREDIP